LVGITALCVYDRWTNSAYTYVNKIDRLIPILSILWTLGHAVTHINTGYTSDLLRGNLWVDLIFHFASAILTLAAYYYYQKKQGETKRSLFHSITGCSFRSAYLIFVTVYAFLSLYVSYKHVKTPQDGDDLAIWWMGATLSVVNFMTVNIYEKDIFSACYTVEFVHAAIVILLQVLNIVSVHTFVTKRYFETLIFGALLSYKYSWLNPASLLSLDENNRKK
jgi:hypothetical protein